MPFTTGISFITQAVTSLLFPPVCSLCESVMSHSNGSICEACLESIRIVPDPVCGKCGMPVPGVDPGNSSLCGRCLIDLPTYEKARFGVLYDGELRRALIKFKYYEATHLGKILSELLAQAFHSHFGACEFHLIIPMPMHPRRLRQRGFNQVVVMGERLSRETGIPLDRTSLKKMKDTLPQVGLSRPKRVLNPRGSFGISRPEKIRGRKVLLIDDVSTTGSTIAEASRIIMKAHASCVNVLVLALRLAYTGHPQYTESQGENLGLSSAEA